MMRIPGSHSSTAAALKAGVIALLFTVSGHAEPENVAAAPPVVAAQPAPVRPQAPARLDVSFKLDPRLSGGSYGGEVWVSPPTFTSPVQYAGEAKVEAKVRVLSARGQELRSALEWTASDPSLVAVSPVSPGASNHVLITVKRAGEATLTVAAAGGSKELHVKGAPGPNGQGMQVSLW